MIYGMPEAIALIVVVIYGLSLHSSLGLTIIALGAPSLLGVLALAAWAAAAPLRLALAREPFHCFVCKTSIARRGLSDHARRQHPEAVPFLRLQAFPRLAAASVGLGFGLLLVLTLLQLYDSNARGTSNGILLASQVGLIVLLTSLIVTGSIWSRRVVASLKVENFSWIPQTSERPRERT
jgi:hypothetical protein